MVDCVYFVVCWSWLCHLIGWLCLFCSMLKLIKPSDWLIVFILQYAEVDQAIWLVDCVYFAVCWSWSCHLIGWLCLFCSMLKLIMPSDWLIVLICSMLIGWLCLFCGMLKLIKPSDWLIVFICSMLIGWLCLFAVCWLVDCVYFQYAEVDQAIWLVDCVYFVGCWILIGWLCLFCSMLK